MASYDRTSLNNSHPLAGYSTSLVGQVYQQVVGEEISGAAQPQAERSATIWGMDKRHVWSRTKDSADKGEARRPRA